MLNSRSIPFHQIPNQLHIEPSINEGEHPLDYVSRLAFEKANASKSSYEGLILGVDTIVNLNGIIMGKPSSVDHAVEMLSTLSGTTHQVITACSLYNSRHHEWHFCIDYASITFAKENRSIIQDYVHSFQPLDKAGAYGIQDQPPFIQSVSGDYDTVMGLPINRLLKIFHHYGIVKEC